MNAIKSVSGLLMAALISGCASMEGASGPHGPKVVGGGRSSELGSYAEIGVQFSSPGDFLAIVSPGRWKSPVKTGGTLSWLNPAAWSEDAGRTGRILAGQAVIVGGAVVAASAGGGAESDSSSAAVPSGPASGHGSVPGGAPSIF